MMRKITMMTVGAALGLTSACFVGVEDAEGDRGSTYCYYYGTGGSSSSSASYSSGSNRSGRNAIPEDAKPFDPEPELKRELVANATLDWIDVHALDCSNLIAQEKLDPWEVCESHGLGFTGEGEGCTPPPDPDPDPDDTYLQRYLASEVLEYRFYYFYNENNERQIVTLAEGFYECGVTECTQK